MNIIIYKNREDLENVDMNQVNSIYKIVIETLKSKLYDILYNAIVVWGWIDLICVNCPTCKLKQLLRCCLARGIIYENFDIYKNVRDIFELNNKLNVINNFENVK
jgi:hypothetical protein